MGTVLLSDAMQSAAKKSGEIRPMNQNYQHVQLRWMLYLSFTVMSKSVVYSTIRMFVLL